MDHITTIYQQAETVQETWNKVIDAFKTCEYDMDASRASLGDVGLGAFGSRVMLAFELLLALRPNEDECAGRTMFEWQGAALRSALATFQKHAESILNTLTPHVRPSVRMVDTNSAFALQLQEGGAAITTTDLGGNFVQLNSAIGQLLSAIAQLSPVLKASSIGDLADRVNRWNQVLHDIKAVSERAVQHSQELAGVLAAAKEQEATIQSLLSQAQAANVSAQSTKSEASAQLADVQALVAQIKAVGAGAGTLEQQVTSYQNQFEAFQKQLDARENQLRKFELDTTQAGEKNQAREAEIDRLIGKADSMIKGATTAGLSQSLEETRALYAARMEAARRGFYVAIALLIVSAIPLAAHLLPWLSDWFPKVDTDPTKTSPYAVLGKIALLIPATWLTRFFSKSFSEFFHLEREYAHKAALAKAVDGFKREAPDFEQQITYGVFSEVLTNPSVRPSPEPAHHPWETFFKRWAELLPGKSKTGS